MSDNEGPAVRQCIFNVPPGARFLDALARAILEGHLPAGLEGPPDPFSLSDYTILLPTQRAARVLQEAFLNVSASGAAMLLPRMRPIAMGEEDATLISGLAKPSANSNDLEIPPAVGELERRLVLMQLVQRWTETLDRHKQNGQSAGAARSPAQSAQLASELARLIDMVETENVSLERLSELVPESYSEHWQQTLDFLQIIVTWWPQILAASNRLSPAGRRNRVILAEAERLQSDPPVGPVIVAGVTGSIPATGELMQAVAALPNGAIVLPGFDQTLSEDDGTAIAEAHPEHPQFGLLRVLRTLNAEVSDVVSLAGTAPRSAISDRNRIVSEVLRPAATTDQWHELPERFEQSDARSAFDRVTYLSAPNSQDEAEAIALILREAAEHPGKTAALISPDRLLARRVAIRLESWGIRVDDSAGRPFPKTVPGAFLDLVINAIATAFEPRALMALLKHPLTRLGRSAFDMRRSARSLEIAAFRAPYLGFGLDGVEAALEKAAQDVHNGSRRGRTVQRMWQEDWDGARQLVADLRQTFAPLSDLFDANSEHSLAVLTKAHVQVAEALAALPSNPADSTVESQVESRDDRNSELWRDEAGQVAARLFAQLLDPELPIVELNGRDYPDFYRALVASEAVRPQIPTHPRIFIWGPFEARLQQPDIVVLGSLNDGTWPEASDPGPWLNRPMRADLGLPSPEEQIGYAAHDFTQLLGAETVYLTRSEVVDGNPTVPSRWLLRLQAVLTRLDIRDALRSQRPWLHWARQRDTGTVMRSVSRPQPRPALQLRPRKLSVSSVETWIANPYALFAERILKLDALPPLGANPDASLRGSVVHEALGRYLSRFPTAMPSQPAHELLAISEEIFAELRSHPRIAAFWIERFRRFAEWFGSVEAGLREAAIKSVGEVSGSRVLDGPGGPFTLTARADRIDITGTEIVITDYKTGANLADLVSRAKSGRSPQLLLEAFIAVDRGFAGVDAAAVSQLRYVSASGGDPPGAIAEVKLDDLTAVVASTGKELSELIARFDHEETPYAATRRAMFRYDYDDYAHLARVAEWGSESQEGGAQ